MYYGSGRVYKGDNLVDLYDLLNTCDWMKWVAVTVHRHGNVYSTVLP